MLKTKRRNETGIIVNRLTKSIVRRALREDLGVRGDVTTMATVPASQRNHAVIKAKSAGVIAGQRVAEEAFRQLDKSVKYSILSPDGSAVDAGMIIARISGPAAAILSGERTALNLLGRCCGIATAANEFVRAVAGTPAKICETRKTAPGLRYLDKASVVVGGGVNHRYALYDAFLIKENHVAAAGGITPAVAACRKSKAGGGKLRVMVEARNWEEYIEAFRAKPDRILLDNMTPVEIAACVAHRNTLMKPGEWNLDLEATGGINLENIRSYAETGVAFISIGGLTHSVKAMDLSLLIV